MFHLIYTRSNTEYYKGERLNHIVDSFYHLLDNFMKINPEMWSGYCYYSYNVSLPEPEVEKN